MSLHLGLDVGGTNIKAVVLDRADTSVAWDGSTPTPAADGPDAVVTRLVAVGRDGIEEVGPVASVGIGFPGVIDYERGRPLFLPNIPGDWAAVPVAATVGRELDAPAHLLNDARAFALAEARLGAGRGFATGLFVTLGTGIGGGVIVRDELHLGLGTAGEFGHQTIDPDGPVCGCGNRGCVEAFAQAKAIAKAGGRETARDVVEAARGGDSRALDALGAAGRSLGIAIGNAIVLLAPERVVVGGGVSQAGDLLLAPARAEIEQRVRVAAIDRIDVVQAELGVLAGAIGAAIWGLERTTGARLH